MESNRLFLVLFLFFIFPFRMEAITAGVSADGSDSSSEGKFDGRGHIFWRAVLE